MNGAQAEPAPQRERLIGLLDDGVGVLRRLARETAARVIMDYDPKALGERADDRVIVERAGGKAVQDDEHRRVARTFVDREQALPSARVPAPPAPPALERYRKRCLVSREWRRIGVQRAARGDSRLQAAKLVQRLGCLA